MKKLLRCVLILFAASSLCACVVQQAPLPNDPYYAPVLRTQPPPDAPSNGSLYRENVAISLFDDRKASRVGDIITVVLREQTTSSKSSNVEITKENDVGIDPDVNASIFGSTPSLGEFGLNTSLRSQNEFTGEADADQSNNLRGDISVTVVDVYPNGTMLIRGEKWITLNRGNEFIRISGLVRPQDVSPDNSVTSTKIANARITYSGTGELAESQEMGWLSRFFNSPIWPF